MKLRTLTVAAAALFACAAYAPAKPAHMQFFSGLKKIPSPGALLGKKGINVSGLLELHSNYIWRGFTLDSEAVLQHGFSLNRKDLTLTYWANWDFVRKDIFDSNELDLSFDYTKRFHDINVSAGAVYYGYYGLEKISRELYGGVELKNVLFSPGLTYYYDYSDGSTRYLSLDASKNIALNKEKKLFLDLSAHAGFSDNLIVDGRSGDLSVNSDINFPLSKRAIFSILVSGSIPFDENSIQGPGQRRKNVSVGIRIGTSF